MKIYVASSWRNPHQQYVIAALCAEGHEVYDFRNPAPGDTGFGWRQCATPEQLADGRRFRDEVLAHPVAQAGFSKDMDALRAADATVLVLPCGRSAHLELGYATGAGQRTIVLLDEPMSEPELMYLMNSEICASLDEVVAVLAKPGDRIVPPSEQKSLTLIECGEAMCALARKHGFDCDVNVMLPSEQRKRERRRVRRAGSKP